MGLRDHLDEALTAEGLRRTRRPARHLQPARPRLLGPRLQRRTRPHGDRQVQDAVHRPDRGDPRRRASTRACASSRPSRSTRCPTSSPTPAPRPTATPDVRRDEGERQLHEGRRLRAQQARRRCRTSTTTSTPATTAGSAGTTTSARRRPLQGGRDRRGRDRRRRARLHRQHRQLQRAEGGPLHHRRLRERHVGPPVEVGRLEPLHRRAVLRPGLAQRAGLDRLRLRASAC